MRLNKNHLLISTYILSLIPKAFFDNDKEYQLGIIKGWNTTLDWHATFYTAIIGFFVMAYCLHYPKGIDRRVTRMILVLTILDFIHLVLFAMQGMGLFKILLSFTIVILYDVIKKRYADS
jgi:hypothetical protein